MLGANTMRESQLISTVNRNVDRGSHGAIYHHSNTGSARSRNGIPDRYYDGPANDAWIEFKYVPAMPRSKLVGGVGDKQGQYTAHQLAWMTRRYNNCLKAGKTPNVFGFVGLPNKTIVIQRTPEEWEHGSSIAGANTYKEAIAWLIEFCTSPQLARSVR